VLEGKKRLLIIAHDNPDPDSIASGWALARVLRRICKIQVDFAYGGIIGRAENQTMTRILEVPVKPLEIVDVESFDAFAMVDCQPDTGNSSLPDGVIPTIVIDHHPLRPQTKDSPFYDVREDYGAAASILTEYLDEADVKVDSRLATALFYAIKTETQNLGREASRADARAFLKYFTSIDNEALSQIENPQISREYFAMVDQAIAGTRIYSDVAVTILHEVTNPDAVAQFADLMIRVEKIHWALTIGRFEQDLLLSLRTNLPSANAGRVIQQVVGESGTAGGHGMMAGGKVGGGASSRTRAAQMERLLRRQALEILGVDGRGVRLVRPTRS